MLRLNYSFSEQLLKITTLHDEHLNHEISAEMFRKVSAKLKRSSVGTPSPANKRQKMESPASSPYSQESSFCQPSPLTANSPLQANTPTSGANTLAQVNFNYFVLIGQFTNWSYYRCHYHSLIRWQTWQLLCSNNR
ncbi:hypothetical protein TELCIR_23280 [Teladorsagia circumcincta]|uniref:Uncharacterized protein n=1 Tax=Teladorsagia circumcincta TaxID=45464 RepID=A0A2G9TBK6_TELCI|nr:hypothetical protein TELCIR_23280 [Teladorsagia circumcincta]